MIPLFKVYCDIDRILTKLQHVFESGYIGQGPKVEEFEKKLQERMGNPYVLTTNSATSAEHLALRLIDLKPGDQVLTTPLTCTATNWPLLAHGADIRWVDVDENNLSLDLDDLARKMNNRTKAIVLVHWGGATLNMDRLEKILDRHQGLYHKRPWIIEDCAHAFGTEWDGKPLSALDDNHFRFYSFQAIKHLTCVDGGCLVIPKQTPAPDQFHATSPALLYDRGKKIRWYGIDRECNSKDFRCEADIQDWGYKFHMNDVCATVGLSNLPAIDWILERHRENANFYFSELSDRHQAGTEKYWLPDIETKCNPSYWLFTLFVDDNPKFMEYMKEKGIMVSRVHERNDKHTCVKQFRRQLPNLDFICQHMVCIPVGWWVTDKQREYIADAIKSFDS
jgi:dTDP-4-amino-4,6-dideoxygalactose transaminase